MQVSRSVSHYSQSRDSASVPIEMELTYTSFKTKISQLLNQHNNNNNKDIEQMARIKALAYAAYEDFRVESAGYEEQICEKIRNGRKDLIYAAQKHLEDFKHKIESTDDNNDNNIPPAKIQRLPSYNTAARIPSSFPSTQHEGVNAINYMLENNITETETDYIISIAAETDGIRKAENVLVDLNIQINNNNDHTNNHTLCDELLSASGVCIVDVGSSVGTNCIELALKLGHNKKCYGIIIEYMAAACNQAVEYAHKKGLAVTFVECEGMSLEDTTAGRIAAEKYKAENPLLESKGHIYIFQGDVTINLPAIQNTLFNLYSSNKIDTVLVTCHAVLHELPTRSYNFTFENLLDHLIINTNIHKWVMYVREPSFPEEEDWIPGKMIYLTIPGWLPSQLYDVAQILADKLPGLNKCASSMEIVSYDEMKHQNHIANNLI
jgi:hypothetical protein